MQKTFILQITTNLAFGGDGEYIRNLLRGVVAKIADDGELNGTIRDDNGYPRGDFSYSKVEVLDGA